VKPSTTAGPGPTSARQRSRTAHRRNLVLLALLSLVLIIGTAAGVLVTENTYRRDRSAVVTRVEREAESIASTLDLLARDRVAVLETIANTLEFDAGGNERIFQAVLNSIDPARLGFTGGIAWVDRSGAVRADSNSSASVGVSARGRDYFDAVIDTDDAFVSELTTSGADPARVVVAVPTHAASAPNEVSGVLTGSIDVGDIASIFPTVEARFGSVHVVDRGGYVLVAGGARVAGRTPSGGNPALLSTATQAKGASERTTGVLGTRSQVVGFAPVRSTGWSVFVEVDHDSHLGALARRRVVVLIVLALLSVSAGAFALRAALRVRRDARLADRTTRNVELLAAAGAALETRDPAPAEILEGACRALVGRVAAYATAYSVSDGAVHLVALATVDSAQERELAQFIGRATPIDADLVFAAAARTGRVQRVEQLDPAAVHSVLRSADTTTRELALRYASGATVAVPFSTDNRRDATPTHVLSAALPVDATEGFDADDVAIITELARRCGAALRTVELRLAAETSRDQAEALQQLSAALSAALAIDDVANAVTLHAARAAGATLANIALPTRSGALRVIHDPALESAVRDRWAEIPTDASTSLAETFRTGQPVWAGNQTEIGARFPDLRADSRTADVHALAAMAVRDASETIIGATGFAWSRPQAFDPEQRARVTAVLAAIAPAVDRARLTEQLQRRRTRAEARARFAAALAAAAGVDEVVRVIADHGMSVLSASGVVVSLFDDAQRNLIIRAVAGTGGEVVARLGSLSLTDGGPMVDAAVTGAPVVVSGIEEARKRFPDREDLHREAAIASLVALPLRAGQVISGAVRVHFRSENDASSIDLDEASVFAAQAAQAVERARLYDRERQRLRRVEQMQAAAAALARAATVEAVANAVAQHAISALGAAWAAVMMRADDGPDELTLLASAGVDDNGYAARVAVDSSTPFGLAILTGRPVYPATRDADHNWVDAAPTTPWIAAEDPDDADVWVALPVGATAYGAIALRFESAGTITLGRRPDIEAFHRLCEHAFTRARRFDVEHEVATVLQASLLPGDLDHVPGVPTTARYRAGRRGTIVGGDWYDLIDLGEGRAGLVVGDVVGRGPRAAAAMGQLRIAVRTLAPFCGPAALLSRLDSIVERVPDAQFATVAYVVVDTAGRTLTWSLAGHPAPLVVRAGTAEYLSGGVGAPLGAFGSMTRREITTSLDGITRLLLYTDGLIERRTIPIDDQFALLARELPVDPLSSDVCDGVIAAMLSGESPTDDVAVLCAEIPTMPVLDVAVPGRLDQLARIRSELRGWLRRLDIEESTANDVLIAVGEACANAIEHGYRERGGEVRVRARRLADAISVEVLDTGDWRPPQPDDTRGRGMPIVHTAMDDVAVRTNDRGTTILLTKVVPAIEPLVQA
jgi:anti-sigma regulatory factor (Ser/Thr protein kinase)/transcriptional regulator with GAF, ATPase, and Fis domain